jgi:hypothetical protein
MSANLGGFISATFDPFSSKPETVEYLVVAGGGGGAAQNNSGGGGGAGGLLTAAGFAVTAGANNTITVGAGGAGGSGARGANGVNSVFSSIICTGGGGGGYTSPGTDGSLSGGSGGGGHYDAQAGGTGISGQGHAGGFAAGAVQFSGGGGGAGTVGLNAGSSIGGNGGAGIAYANELRLATEEEKAANKRFIKVKHKIQYGIPVLSNSKAGCIYFPYTSVTIGIDLASGPDWTPPVSINGEDNA